MAVQCKDFHLNLSSFILTLWDSGVAEDCPSYCYAKAGYTLYNSPVCHGAHGAGVITLATVASWPEHRSDCDHCTGSDRTRNLCYPGTGRAVAALAANPWARYAGPLAIASSRDGCRHSGCNCSRHDHSSSMGSWCFHFHPDNVIFIFPFLG